MDMGEQMAGRTVQRRHMADSALEAAPQAQALDREAGVEQPPRGAETYVGGDAADVMAEEPEEEAQDREKLSFVRILVRILPLRAEASMREQERADEESVPAASEEPAQ